MKRDRKQRPRSQSPRAAASRDIGSIRIISGQWRGRKLPVLDAQGLRPTTDSTKETVFNWLMHDVIDAHCLDLFAGSGGLGFEALSRHAKKVTFVEKQIRNARQLENNLKSLKADADLAEVKQTDALQFLEGCQQPFDIIFIDPPFGQDLVQPCLELIDQQQCLNEHGIVYIEVEKGLDISSATAGLSLLKQKSTHQVSFSLWTKAN